MDEESIAVIDFKEEVPRHPCIEERATPHATLRLLSLIMLHATLRLLNLDRHHHLLGKGHKALHLHMLVMSHHMHVPIVASKVRHHLVPPVKGRMRQIGGLTWTGSLRWTDVPSQIDAVRWTGITR